MFLPLPRPENAAYPEYLPGVAGRVRGARLYECFYSLYDVVLTNEQFLKFLPVARADFLQAIDLTLNRCTLPFPPQALENPYAVVGIAHVCFALARDRRRELGIHSA